jgi:SAM-dependent methyltransferase
MSSHALPSLQRLLRLPCPWPLPAVLAWAAAWLAWGLGHSMAMPAEAAWLFGLGLGSLPALAIQGVVRKAIVALGFPLSSAVLGLSSGLPGWLWLLALLPLLLAYPLRAWRDAPFFPTPADALCGLPQVMRPPQRVLEAGCGLGHGLLALRQVWPQAALHGVEWSPVLALAARLRCPWAQVRRGDMWGQDWAAFDVVYLFQRPESMQRAWDKACAQMGPGSWLVSLEFAIAGVAPHAQLQTAEGKPLWVYRTRSPAALNQRRPRPITTQASCGPEVTLSEQNSCSSS